MTAARPISDLRSLSAKLGRDPMLAQAASGNTSIKIDGMLWIKASGKWLADADLDEIFVPVDMGTMSAGGTTLTPSIETAMHAVLPQRVVIHVHSVNVIAWSVLEDGAEQVAERLAGLRWAWIPYVPSGYPLARQVQQSLSSSPDVFLLGNHGLVVAAEDCCRAEALLREVEKRLELEPRKAEGASWAHLDRMARGSGWRVPAEEEVHFLGTDPYSRAIFTGGTLYPCHGMFLGPGSAECDACDAPGEAAEDYQVRHGAKPSTMVVRGKGLLVVDDITLTQMQVLVGLSSVIQRIGREARVRYLTDAETSELYSTDAHHYRRNVEAREFAVS